MSTLVSPIDKDARAIVALDVWKKVGVYNWVLSPQTSEEPVVVHVEPKNEDPVTGRIFFFPGFASYRDFALLMQAPDAGVALSPLDVTHWELICFADGRYEMHSFRAGYAPHLAGADELEFLAPLVHECLGLLMRFEEDPELPAKYADQQAMFARIEGLDGKWRDGPCPTPKDDLSIKREERITLGRNECNAAAHLPFAEGEVWEADFYGVPACRTEEPQPRIMYLFAAVDVRTGRRCVWDRMSVSKTEPSGLKPLWESLAQRLLLAILKNGRIPGSVNVRSGRMARFLRPLGLQIPFRLVQHRKLPMLDSIIKNAIQSKTI